MAVYICIHCIHLCILNAMYIQYVHTFVHYMQCISDILMEFFLIHCSEPSQHGGKVYDGVYMCVPYSWLCADGYGYVLSIIHVCSSKGMKTLFLI